MTHSHPLHLVIAHAALITPHAAAQTFEIPWYTIDCGGGASSGGAFELSGAIGQPDAGEPLSGGPFRLTGGFWAARAQPCIADFNRDGAVDTRDVLAYLNAWAARDPSADVNGDGLVDSRDVLAYLNLWTAGC